MDGLDATSFDGCALPGLRGPRPRDGYCDPTRSRWPARGVWLTYLNLFTQVGVLTAL